MPKKSIQKKPIQWEVYRLKGSPAAFVGIAYAPDEKAALKAAIRQFEIAAEPGAVNIPLRVLKERLVEINPDREIVAYCRGDLRAFL